MTSTPKHRLEKSKGFVGIVFLAIALIGIVIAAIAAMSRSQSGSTAAEAAKTNASVLIKQSTDLKNAYDMMIIDGGSQQTLSYNSAASYYFVSNGTNYGQHQLLPDVAFAPSPPYGKQWIYMIFANIPGVGSAGPDYIISAIGLTKEVCQAINHNLYGDSISAAPAMSAHAAAYWWPGGPSSANDTSVTATNYVGRVQNCVQSTDGYYIYYHVMQES